MMAAEPGSREGDSCSGKGRVLEEVKGPCVITALSGGGTGCGQRMLAGRVGGAGRVAGMGGDCLGRECSSSFPTHSRADGVNCSRDFPCSYVTPSGVVFRDTWAAVLRYLRLCKAAAEDHSCAVEILAELKIKSLSV